MTGGVGGGGAPNLNLPSVPSGESAAFPAVTSTTVSLVVDRQTGSGQPGLS